MAANSIPQLLKFNPFTILFYWLESIFNIKTASENNNISETPNNNKVHCEIINTSKTGLVIKISK